MRKRSKRYDEDFKKAVKEVVSLPEAVQKIKSFASTKFDQSVECVMHLGIDPKHADQMIRGAISLPNGIGKARKVIAFCEDSDIDAAKEAGAMEAGSDDLVKKIMDGWMDFDVAIASPKVMGKAGKLGRVLGRICIRDGIDDRQSPAQPKRVRTLRFVGCVSSIEQEVDEFRVEKGIVRRHAQDPLCAGLHSNRQELRQNVGRFAPKDP